MTRVLPVCVVRTADGGIKFFETHNPIPAQAGGHVTLNLSLGNQVVSLHLCKRCRVAYVDSEAVTYDAAGNTPVLSPHGGDA